MKFYKYQGCGNDFIMINNTDLPPLKNSQKTYHQWCNRHFGIGADGVIEVLRHPDFDFEMRYYNADGSIGSMCGNGGRCAVRFAHFLGLMNDNKTRFVAADGVHTAQITADTVRLSMADIQGVLVLATNEFFVNTGSPHHVIFGDLLPDAAHVQSVGSSLRQPTSYAPTGANVNFITENMDKNTLNIRTFERGVEAETLACGTGATAAAAAAAYKNHQIGKQTYHINTLGGILNIGFNHTEFGVFNDVFLAGAADVVFQGTVEI